MIENCFDYVVEEGQLVVEDQSDRGLPGDDDFPFGACECLRDIRVVNYHSQLQIYSELIITKQRWKAKYR